MGFLVGKFTPASVHKHALMLPRRTKFPCPFFVTSSDAQYRYPNINLNEDIPPSPLFHGSCRLSGMGTNHCRQGLTPKNSEMRFWILSIGALCMQFQVHAESEAEEAMVGNLKSPILMAQTWKGPENTRETQHWMCGHGANSGGQEGFSDSARMWDTKN